MFVIKIKYKLKFEKTGRIRFTGHLDLLKIFQRSIIRAEVPIGFSQGFNPHQLMSFGLPLSLGMASVGEYLDIELAEDMSSTEIMERLNGTLPKGIKIINVSKTPEGEKNSASLLTAGKYKVDNIKISNLQKVVNDFINQDEIIIEKITKKSTKEVDIKPNIYEINATDDSVDFIISTGSVANIKPNLVMEALYTFAKLELPLDIVYTRIDMYKSVDGKLFPIL